MCQQESQLGVLQVPMFFLICSVVMLLSVASSTAPLVLYWAATAPRWAFTRHGCTSLPEALERALGRPTLLRVRSLVLFFSVRFRRYMRTVSLLALGDLIFRIPVFCENIKQLLARIFHNMLMEIRVGVS